MCKEKKQGWLQKAGRIARIAAIVLMVGLAAACMVLLRDRDLKAIMPESRLLAGFLLLLLYAVKSLAVAVPPFVALFVVAGAVFPSGAAILLTLAGFAVNITIGHCIGRRFGMARMQAILMKYDWVKNVIDRLGKNDQTMCFVARLLPLPFEPLSIFLGASGVSYFDHLVFSLLGVAPGMVPVVMAGNAIENPLSSQFLLPFGISIAISLAAFLVLRRLKGYSGPPPRQPGDPPEGGST